MALKKEYKIRCGCGARFTAPVCEYLLAEYDPELKDAILSGDFNQVSCPSCGQRLRVEIPFLYRDEKNRLFVWVCAAGDERKRKKLEKELIKEKSRMECHFVEGADPGKEMLVFGREALVGLLLKEDPELKGREGRRLKRNPAIRVIPEGQEDPGFLVLCGEKVRVAIPLGFPRGGGATAAPEFRKKWLRHYSTGLNLHNPYSSFLTPRMKREWDRVREKEPLPGSKDEFDEFATSWAHVRTDPKGFRARHPEKRRFFESLKDMDVPRKVCSLRMGRPR